MNELEAFPAAFPCKKLYAKIPDYHIVSRGRNTQHEDRETGRLFDSLRLRQIRQGKKTGEIRHDVARNTGPAKSLALRSARVRRPRVRGVNQQSYSGPITIRRALISYNAPFFSPGTNYGRPRSDGLHVADNDGPGRSCSSRSTFTISQ